MPWALLTLVEDAGPFSPDGVSYWGSCFKYGIGRVVCVRFGVWVLVPLSSGAGATAPPQGAAAPCALMSFCAGAAAGCWWRRGVPLPNVWPCEL